MGAKWCYGCELNTLSHAYQACAFTACATVAYLEMVEGIEPPISGLQPDAFGLLATPSYYLGQDEWI